MTKPIKTKVIVDILTNRADKNVLMPRYSDPVLAARFSGLYDGAVYWLTGLCDARNTVAFAKNYLTNSGSVSRITDMPTYLLFSRKVWKHLRQNSLTAQTLIQTDFDQFVSWGYDASILRALAHMQNVTVP